MQVHLKNVVPHFSEELARRYFCDILKGLEYRKLF
jgi:hypothetical protein